MKAHIAALPPAAALAWKVPQGSGLEKVCAGAGVRLRTVEEQDLGRTVADLCGHRKVLDAFLDGLKAAGVRIPLKAVVTDTNRAWTFAALLEELHAEHRAVQKNDK